MKKGFTLIELLAVIVILAIIAVIAVPIVIDIINDAKESAALRSADFYLREVELAIANSTLKEKNIPDGTYDILPSGNVCLEYTDSKCTSELVVKVKGEVPKYGTATITDGEISAIEFVYENKTIIQDNEGKLVFGEAKKACTYVDSEDDTGDAIGTIDLSDVVTCGTENFYVMFNENDEITMLSMYNLDVGNIVTYDSSFTKKITAIENPTGIQNERAKGFQPSDSQEDDFYYGTVAFANTNYWAIDNGYDFDLLPGFDSGDKEYPFVYGDYKDSQNNQQNLLYPYVSSYEKYLKKNGVNSASATVISLEQLDKLGCSLGSWSCSRTSLTWLYSTSYWLGSAEIYGNGCYIEYGDFIYCGGQPDVYDYVGVRPVITISINEIQ